MIYDCFPFNNELDMLEIRLNHHSQFVDKFVLTECPWTYSGRSKPLYYDQVKDRSPFKEFKDRIIHNIYNISPNGKTNWAYEHDQRNSLRRIPFVGGDLIIYADCDEIIRDKSVIERAAVSITNYGIVTLDMELNWYYFNCVIKPGSKFQKDYSMEVCFNHRWRMAKIFSPVYLKVFKNLYKIREANLWELQNDFTIESAGWHFSNIGDPILIDAKFRSFSHSEQLKNKYHITADLIAGRKAELRDPLGRDVSFVRTELDVPAYILDNIEKYEGYILNADNS